MDAVKLDERQVRIESVIIKMDQNLCRRGILISFLDEITPSHKTCTEEYFREFNEEALSKINHKNILHFLRDFGLDYVVEKIVKIGSYNFKGKMIEICEEYKQPNYFSLNNVRYLLKDM